MPSITAPGSRKQLNVRLPAHIHRALYARAAPEPGGITKIVVRALERELGLPGGSGNEVAARQSDQTGQVLGEHEDRIGDHERRLQRIEEAANL